MRRSRTLSRLRENKTARICGLGHFIPSFIRHAAHFGFDAIWLDAEHRCFTDRELQALLTQFHLHDIDCMLRPPTLELSRLYRYLEDGATGLMIPHVSTPEKAQMLADAVKFPPIGNRGLDGAGLDSDFYLDYSDDWTDRANAETFLVVQIETPEAVANVDAIAAIQGIDGIFVGPGDLGLRLRQAGESMELEAAIAAVATACATHGKAWGLPVGTEQAMQQRFDQGARILAHGGDFMALMKMLEESAGMFHKVTGE